MSDNEPSDMSNCKVAVGVQPPALRKTSTVRALAALGRTAGTTGEASAAPPAPLAAHARPQPPGEAPSCDHDAPNTPVSDGKASVGAAAT